MNALDTASRSARLKPKRLVIHIRNMIRAKRSRQGLLSAKVLAAVCACAILIAAPSFPQTASNNSQSYPKSIRGYKVESAKIVLRTSETSGDAESVDALVRLGDPEFARVTPLGITFEVPIWISPVKQGGRVDSLAFEDIVVNGIDVSIDDYLSSFELPKKKPLRLPRPLRIFVSSPGLVGGVLDEWMESKERWRITGRVYVFGRFRKYLMKIKRAIPIEVDVEIPNPLNQRDPSGK